MPKYVDGFLMPIPKKNRKKYIAMARAAGKVWLEHGALAYFECAPDFEKSRSKQQSSFGQGLAVERGEEIWFSFIVYRSKANRNAVNKKVMDDPRLAKWANKPMPFDHTRMHYGGFSPQVVFEKKHTKK